MGKSMLDSGRVSGRIQLVQKLPASAGSRPQPHASWFSYILCSKASWVASVISIFCFVSDPNLTGQLLLRMQQPEFLLIAQDLAL